MSRYIDLDGDDCVWCGNPGEYENWNVILDIPGADVAPVVHAHWEKVDTRGYLSPGGTPTVRCSHCKDRRTEHLSGVEYPEWRNFCPVCGALMNEVTES